MNIDFIKSAAKFDQFPITELPEICFIGRSNVGKSSILNMLVGKKGIAKVGKTPGKTRLANFFNIDNRYIFTDLPGYGYAHVSRKERNSWIDLINKYLTRRRNLRLAILLLDSRRIPNDNDLEMFGRFKYINVKVLIVATKTDKLSNNQLSSQIKVIANTLKISKDEIVTATITNPKCRNDILDIIFKF